MVFEGKLTMLNLALRTFWVISPCVSEGRERQCYGPFMAALLCWHPSKSIKVTLQNVSFETLVRLSLAATEPQSGEMQNSSIRVEKRVRGQPSVSQFTLPFPNTSQLLMTIIQMPWLWQRALRTTIFIEQVDLRWHCNV